ncbi:MAG TPA: hypothetical protein DEO33_04715 [Rikenellaceae bacterium]|nr:hypothetical protein [Rikenellaceae bacterium]
MCLLKFLRILLRSVLNRFCQAINILSHPFQDNRIIAEINHYGVFKHSEHSSYFGFVSESNGGCIFCHFYIIAVFKYFEYFISLFSKRVIEVGTFIDETYQRVCQRNYNKEHQQLDTCSRSEQCRIAHFLS